MKKGEEKIAAEEIKTTGVPSTSRAGAVFLRPVVSEKISALGAYDTYAFAVRRPVNKIEVKKAFWSIYNVWPVSVRMIIMPAKSKRTRKIRGVRPEWKKALIRVPKGSKISIFEGV